jgi:hypothetical protein
LLAASSALLAEYKLEAAGAPPSEVAPAIAVLLQPAGHRVLGPDGKVYCEIWFRKEAPKGPESTEVDLMWKTVPPGSIIGVAKYHAEGHDRRGHILKPGVYTLRFSMFPINGDHQGVAPNRDFLVMAPAASDTSVEPVGHFETLVNMSRKVSGGQHPAVLSMWLIESDFKPGIHQLGEDWAIHIKVGEAQVGLIVIGKVEA